MSETWSKVSREDGKCKELLKGRLLILWEELSINSVPLRCVGQYYPGRDLENIEGNEWGNGTEVLAVEIDSVKQCEKKDLRYLLYTLSPESKQILDDKHLEIINKIGYVKDYGPNYGHKKDTSEEFDFYSNKYSNNLDIRDLDVKFYGVITYSSIINPYPYVVIENNPIHIQQRNVIDEMIEKLQKEDLEDETKDLNNNN